MSQINEPSTVTDNNEPTAVTDDSEPTAMTENNEPIEMVTVNNEPNAMVTENSEPIEMLTENNEPTAMLTENSELTAMVTENKEPTTMVTENSEPTAMVNIENNSTQVEEENSRLPDEKGNSWLRNKLLEIKESNEEVYTFKASLSSKERQYLRKRCRVLGLRSKNCREGHQTQISILKRNIQKAGIKGEKKEKIVNQKAGMKAEKKEKRAKTLFMKTPHLTFSDEGKNALCDLFASYPPEDDEAGAEPVKLQKQFRNFMRSEYDIFSKTSLSKADIKLRKNRLVQVSQQKKIRQMIKRKSQLPIAPFKDIITSTIESHQVVLLSGETGCGKTTQVPQFILDSMWDKGEECKIICSQPRRISATSVAERIAAERGQNVGEDVGYKIRFESKGGNKSSIVFCTNGVLLRILVSKGSSSSISDAKNKARNDALSQLTHIIVDEIHERDRYSDFMLAILRDELPSYPHLRLIIMSATLDAEMFSKYFGGCPVIRVPGFTHPVKAFYLEDVVSILTSSESSQLSSSSSSILIDSPALTQEDKLVLEDAITTAWSSDEFESLLDLIQSEGTMEVFNYQHSVNGMTPLMVFAGKGRIDEVRMLLSFGADCSLRDINGENAIELAKRLNQFKAVEIISNHIKNVGSNLDEEKKTLEKYLKLENSSSINITLIVKLIKKICNDSEDGAILVFLPGWEDIRKIRDMLFGSSFFKDESEFLILSLHSMVPPEDQKLVFLQPPTGCRKIILSTNIAETSVTIDDVVYVIDSGKMKEKSYDPHTNVSTLQVSWVSKASVKQREGRAGRCQPGVCYHLFTREREATLLSFQIPEIKRIPMEEICLQVKMMDPDSNIETILEKTIDPPVHETIRNGISVLQGIGALSHDERLTELGAKLALLPVNPLVSKMLFLAILLKCLDPALTFACSSDYKDPFVFPFDGRGKAAAAKAKMASIYDGNSDQLAVIAAFECWKRAKENCQEYAIYSDYYISPSTMSMLSGMRKQLLSELRTHGFLPDDISSYNVNAHDPGILHAVLVAGLYPRVGRLFKAKSRKHCLVEIPNGSKVRLHNRSAGSGIPVEKVGNKPLIIYDEITRTDCGQSIRHCTFIGPLPLLLNATKIAVAPIAGSSEDSTGEGGSGHCNEEILIHNGDSKDVMSSPTREVMVIVDRWLSFRLTANDFAKIYCMRKRISKAVTYMVTHPGSELPVVLAASMHALACLLSYDGMSNMGFTRTISKSSPSYIGEDKFLLSLLSPTQPFGLAEPPASPEDLVNETVNSESIESRSPSISAADPLLPKIELPSSCEFTKSKRRKKKKSAALSSTEPIDPALTCKPTLVGYDATTYRPCGPRGGEDIQQGSAGVKRHREAS